MWDTGTQGRELWPYCGVGGTQGREEAAEKVPSEQLTKVNC